MVGEYIINLGKRVKLASKEYLKVTANKKNEMLKAISKAILENVENIINANKIDLDEAKKNNMSDAMIDRLMLNEARISQIANALLDVVKLNDPIGMFDGGKTMANGLQILTKRVPLGVVGIIYESRPNVTVDAAALCIKSSNAVILRGGKEAINTNVSLVKIMRNAINTCDINPDVLILIDDTSREISNQMMRLNGYIDVLIPRGGEGLIKAVVENATVPVIETGTGNCHVFVDESAKCDMAIDIVYNAKCSRPSVCNAIESLLVHEKIAKSILPKINAKLKEKNVVIKGCEQTKAILGEDVIIATEEDYHKEFLDYIIAVRVVKDIDMAIEHIMAYTTGHSECIITEDYSNATKFTNEVDAAAVYVNASTRFTDGGEFGLGAEIGISTQKLHARGPMGLEHMTTIKYVVTGNGQIR